MKFLIDENVRHSVGGYLALAGHDVRFLARTTDQPLTDHDVLQLAVKEGRVLVTNDKDFGQLIYQQQRSHSGVILFRISQETEQSYLRRLEEALQKYHKTIQSHFLIITDKHLRFR